MTAMNKYSHITRDFLRAAGFECLPEDEREWSYISQYDESEVRATFCKGTVEVFFAGSSGFKVLCVGPRIGNLLYMLQQYGGPADLVEKINNILIGR